MNSASNTSINKRTTKPKTLYSWTYHFVAQLDARDKLFIPLESYLEWVGMLAARLMAGMYPVYYNSVHLCVF